MSTVSRYVSYREKLYHYTPIIHNGYNLVFGNQGPLPLSKSPRAAPRSRPSSHQAEAALTLETKKLLGKGVIEVVKDHSSPGFYSHLFLVDKRDRGSRPVIDLWSTCRYSTPISRSPSSRGRRLPSWQPWGRGDGPERRILPHTDHKAVKEVSSLRDI